MKVHPKSSWSKDEIFQYLDETTTPMRLSVVDGDSYPVICSLWFVHHQGTLWAASHKNSHIIRALKNDPKVAFEVANNDYPYKGVRGKGEVTLTEDVVENTLEKVAEKYLQGGNQKLANWLLSRKEDEYSIRITPKTMNAWDFSSRMEPQA